MTLIEFVQELRANGVREFDGLFEGERVRMTLAPGEPSLPDAKPDKAGERRGVTGMTRSEQVELYGQVFLEDFQE